MSLSVCKVKLGTYDSIFLRSFACKQVALHAAFCGFIWNLSIASLRKT